MKKLETHCSIYLVKWSMQQNYFPFYLANMLNTKINEEGWVYLFMSIFCEERSDKLFKEKMLNEVCVRLLCLNVAHISYKNFYTYYINFIKHIWHLLNTNIIIQIGFQSFNQKHFISNY